MKKTIRKYLLKISIILIVVLISSCLSKKIYRETVDNNFVNPVIFADFPDVDVIRVGSDYYMISTTIHMMPGAPVMKSKDLVNWEYVAYLYDEMNDDPAYYLDGGSIYGRGQWAASLRYHKGRFYVLFGTINNGRSYLFSTTDPAGKWDKIVINEYLHDASLLFDDDGKVYVAYGGSNIIIREFNSDMKSLKSDGINKVVISGISGLLEGTHIFKHDDKYYMMLIWWPQGGRRTQLCFRSDKIDGIYERKTILDDDMGYRNQGIAQGVIVDTEKRDWYAMLFQDHGAVGRVPILMPATWQDGWPMLGDSNGRVPKMMKKPIQGYKSVPLTLSDEFDNISKETGKSKLAMNWQWNHNPDNQNWSLTERKGFLRLRTGKVVSHIFEARNTLTQRTEGPGCTGIISMDVSEMKNGDYSGFSAFSYHYGYIGIKNENGKKYIILVDRDKEIESRLLEQNTIYFKINFEFNTDIAKFSYSLDRKKWSTINYELKMQYTTDHFIGYRFALFNYATKDTGGIVDFDFFKYFRHH